MELNYIFVQMALEPKQGVKRFAFLGPDERQEGADCLTFRSWIQAALSNGQGKGAIDRFNLIADRQVPERTTRHQEE
jgi:hypothetical protein